MRSLTKSNPKTRQSQDREANRKPKHRRLLEIEVLEDRLPVSEQLGTALGVSALSYIGGLTARRAVPLLAEQQQSGKVRAEEPSKASGIAVVWPSATSESAAARAAVATGQLIGTMGQARGSNGIPVAVLGIKDLGPKPLDELSQDYFDLLGSSTPGRRGNMARMTNAPDSGVSVGKVDPLLNQSAAGGTGTALGSGPGVPPPAADSAGYGSPRSAGSLPTASAAGFLAAHTLSSATNGTSTIQNTEPPPPPDGGGGGPKKKKDAYNVLDANNAIVVTPGVPEHALAGAAVDLRQQVSGLAASSYSWTLDPNHLSDFTSVSGQSTYRLQFTWASFTGAAHTDTITSTYTDTSSVQHSLTLTFAIDSTSSPAWSSAPTSFTTWPTVQTPDALAAGQATVDSQYYSLGLATGGLLINHGLPPYNPGVPALALAYNSTAADRMPIFIDHYELNPAQAVPATVSAQLTVKDRNGTNVFSGTTVSYNTGSTGANENPGDILQIPLQATMPSTQATGEYAYTITVTGNSTSTVSGQFSFVNLKTSVFGDGWSVAGLEHVYPVSANLSGSISAGAIVDLGGGLSLWYPSNGLGGYNAPQPNDFSSLSVSGTVYTRTLPDGTKINFDSSLDSHGGQTSVAAPNGNLFTYAYDASGNLLTITDFDNNVTTLTYSSGKVGTVAEPAYTMTLGYNGSGQLTSITDPAPGAPATTPVTTFGYASTTVDRITRLQDPDSNSTTFSYSSAGRVQSLQRPDLINESLTALQVQGLSTATLAVEDQAQYTDGRVKIWKSSLDWLGYGLPTQEQDPLNNMAAAYRDGNGLPWLSADPLGDRTRTFFNSSASDATQQANPLEVVLPDDSVITYTYDSTGRTQPTSVTVGDPSSTTYSYCTCHCLQSVKQPTVTNALTGLSDNPTWNFTDTSHGFLGSGSDALSNTTTYAYDIRDRVTTITYAGATGRLIPAYNSASEVTSVTDELSHVTTYAYDGLGRVVGVSLPTGGQISYTYDAASNILTVKDPDGNVTTYHYDAMNRVSYVTDPGSLQNTTYTYDNTGNFQSITDLDNRQRTFGYDNAGRLVTETWITTGTPTFTYTYDAASRLIKAQDPSSVYSYAYDSRGRLLSVDNVNSPPGVPHLALSYTYDKVSNRLTLSDSSNGGVTYSYDAAERLTGAWMFASGSTSVPQITLGYDLDGQLRVVGRQIGGTAQITSSYDYTPRNQVKYIQHTSSSAGTLATYTYTYDDALRLTTYMGPEGTVTFGYDSTNQLTSASRSMPESYGYDNNGNRNTGSYMTAAGNRLTFNGTYTYTYDNQGNVLTKFDSAGDVATYTWDFRNRLTRGQTSGVNLGTHDVTFTYDMFDRRIEKSTSSGNTWTVYDEANPYADFSGSMLQYRYLYGRTVDALFARFDGTSGNDSTIWYLTENLGSVRQMAKTDGTVTATITYDSFGQIQGTFIGDRFKFAGREYDSETGLYYNRERYYDPSVGRFLSEDPLGLRAGDSNLYRYVGNAPTWRIDPSGLDWANDLIGAFCVAVWGPVYGPAVYRVVDSGPVGGAVEGGSVGLGVGILAGLAVGSLNPAAGAGGGIVGSLAGAGYGAQLGSSQPDFFTGAAAAGDPRTIVVGLAGGILGGEVGNRIFPAQPPPSATSA